MVNEQARPENIGQTLLIKEKLQKRERFLLKWVKSWLFFTLCILTVPVTITFFVCDPDDIENRTLEVYSGCEDVIWFSLLLRVTVIVVMRHMSLKSKQRLYYDENRLKIFFASFSLHFVVSFYFLAICYEGFVSDHFDNV